MLLDHGMWRVLRFIARHRHLDVSYRAQLGKHPLDGTRIEPLPFVFLLSPPIDPN
jgi:hypothetical protein